MNKENRNSILLAISLIILLLIVVVARERFVVSKNNKNINLGQVAESKNVLTGMKSDQTINILINLLETKNSMEVYKAFDTLASKETDKSKYESLRLYAAASLAGLDRTKGADYYMGIANDKSLSNITRAYAMTQITQYASGYSDNNLLKVFFAGDEYKKLSNTELRLQVNQKILEIYPFGIASARVARFELMKTPSTTTAKTMYDKYISDIKINISNFTGVDGLSHFIPSTYLNTAFFLVDAKKYGVSNEAEIRSYYDKAYSTSIADQNTVTAEFTLLSYANYLLKEGDKSDAESLISKLLTINTGDMVRNETKNGLANYPSLNAYSKTGTELANQLKAKYSVAK